MSIVLKDGTVLPDIPTAYTDDRFIGVAPDLATLKYHYVCFQSSTGNYYLTCSDIPVIAVEDGGTVITALVDFAAQEDGLNYSTFVYNPDEGISVWTDGDSGLVSENGHMWFDSMGPVVWADYDINFVDPHTGEPWGIYFPNSLAKPPFVLPDGTELPALPDGCFDGTPYGIIISSDYQGNNGYALFSCHSGFAFFPIDVPGGYLSGMCDFVAAMGEYHHYEWGQGLDAWEEVGATTERLELPAGTVTSGPLAGTTYWLNWSNCDIPKATGFNSDNNPVVSSEIARKSDVNYRVTGGYMTSIANEGRRLGNREGQLKPAELEDALRNAESGKNLPNGEETTFGYVFEGGVETVYVYAGFDNIPKEAQQLHFVICKNRNDEYRLEAREIGFYAKLYDDAYYRLETTHGKMLSYMLRDGIWVEEFTTGNWIDLREWPTIIYSTDNISNSSGGYITTAGTPEIREVTAGSTMPVLRETEYRMTSDTMNRMCYIAQMAAGRQDLILPDTALDVLENNASGWSSAPNAEDFYFGGVTSSFGFADDTSPFDAGYAFSGSTYCNVFKAQTDFEVIGFRIPGGTTFQQWFFLWDINGTLLAEGSATMNAPEGEWAEFYLGKGIQVNAECEYVVGVYANSQMKKAKAKTVQPNEKIVLTKFGSGSNYKTFPTTWYNFGSATTSGGEIAAVDIIIGELEEMPEVYLVSADTMNSIAAAIQTYVGIPHSYSMTTAQMISMLNGS